MVCSPSTSQYLDTSSLVNLALFQRDSVNLAQILSQTTTHITVFHFTFQILRQAQLLHVATSRWPPRWRRLCTQPSGSVQDAEPELVLLFSILRQRRRGGHHPHSGGSSCIRAFLWVFYQTQLGYGLVC